MTPTQPTPEVLSGPARLSHEALVDHLKQVSIFQSLEDEAVECLDEVEQVQCEPGATIARQGDAATYFFILLTGRLRVFATRSDGSEMTMATMPAGTTFGELPLLANIQNQATFQALEHCFLLRLNVEEFWHLMTECPEVRKFILGNMATRLQKMQGSTVQQEKMAALGTLAAGLMHELNNPGAAARRASSQLRENLLHMHELSARFTRIDLTPEQKLCLLDLQKHALASKLPIHLNSLEQTDAEEALADWMQSAQITNAWKIAPTLVSIGIDQSELACARASFTGTIFSDALNWLDALVSSMQLVGTIEESIGRVTDLVGAVKSYAYEGKGQRQSININESLHATLVILGHKIREKQIVLEKTFAPDLPQLESTCTGLNQIWTNLLDNAIDATPQGGHIRVRTWPEDHGNSHIEACITIEDDGAGIPLDSQAHIFDPFYTTKPAGIGTGLGLGIVHRVVEQFGGTIRFTSTPGNTLFLVRLPAHSTSAN